MQRSEEETNKFYEWLWPHRDVVLRTARLLIRDSATADDLAQDTMLKAFRSIGRFQPGTNARAWLLSILRNVRIDRLRSNAARRGEVSLAGHAEDIADPHPADAHATGRGQHASELLEQFGDAEVIAALRSLPEEIRWTLLIVDVEGLDQSEAAAALDVPVGTVKSRLHRGRAMLRTELEPRARDLKLIR